MPNAAVAADRGWLRPALLAVAAITAARIALLALSRADLFVDEAQYWLWGQDLAFGYYSKPPLIAWVIRASTELGGSDAPFWVRLPAPLFHAVTALVLGGIAARLWSDRAALVTALAYATLPMVALGSLLISTDTIMFPFLSGALALYLRLIAPGGGGRPHLAALAGLLLGLAFLAKYAALYYLGLGALAALVPRLRPDPRDALALLAAFLIVALPNLVWNIMNGLATLSHTVDNTGWESGLVLRPEAALRFLAEQLLVAGPVVFVAFVLAALGRAEKTQAGTLLRLLSLPVVVLVTLQALISGANANWAAAAYLAGLPLAVVWLLARRRIWLILSFAVNGALSLALPLAATQADSLRWDGRLLLGRYVGLDEFSHRIRAEAAAQGARAIVASERALLADLLYSGQNGPTPVFATPHDGAPRHHYEQRYAYQGDASGPVLTVYRDRDDPPPCTPLTTTPLIAGPGAYEGRSFTAALVPADCWGAP